MDVDDERAESEVDELTCCGEVERLSPDLLGREALVREVNADKGTTLFVASTPREDRTLYVVEQDWDLKEFRAIGVILDNHVRSRVVGVPISAVVPRKGDDAGQLMIDVRWDLESPDPTIVNVGSQHLRKIRKTGSVGFTSESITRRDKLARDHKAYREPKKFTSPWGFEYEDSGLYFKGNKLLEFSSAPIPANADAAQRSWVDYLAEVDPLDIDARARRAGEIQHRSSAETLREWAADPAKRAETVAILWPDILEQLRRDDAARRVLRAILDAGPPPAPARPALRGDGLDFLFPPTEAS